MPKVVFDTVVFVRSLINPHGLWGQLVFARAREYRLIVSKPVVQEVTEVLRRPELTRKYRSVATRDLRAILSLFSYAEAVEIGEDLPRVCRDPNDDKFLATARAANARYLVSEDEDLLELTEYEGTKIVDAATFLQILDELKGGGNHE